jgi:hypothetical protein
MNRLSTRLRSLLTMPMILCLALLSLLLSLNSATAATITVTLGASADTYLSTDSPGSNFGSAESLTISQNSDRVLLRFNLALPTGATIESATLQTYSEAADKANFIVHPSTGSWDEASVTYQTQPAWDSKELARSDSALRKGRYVAADLPVSAVPTSGTVSFGLDTTASRRSGNIASRESAKAPQLVVTYSRATAPSPSATSTTATGQPSPTATSTTATGQPSPTATSTTATGQPSPTATPTGVSHTLAAVGDTCSTSGTTQQCAETATAVAGINPERFLHLGDFQYQNAGANGATDKTGYEAAFAALHSKTIPVYGATHDTCDGAGSWECYPVSFMNVNGAPEVRGKLTDHQWGYSLDIGNWHVVVFNYKTAEGGSVASVTADLDAHPSQCLLAIDHAPVIGSPSSEHSTNEASAFKTTLVNHGVDLVLNGHQHFYERNLDSSGFTDITNGEGGIGHYNRTSTAATAMAYNDTSFGPLKVVLSANGWTTDFVPNAGAAAFSDHASGGCS